MPVEFIPPAVAMLTWLFIIRRPPPPTVPKKKRFSSWRIARSDSQFATMAWTWWWNSGPQVGEIVTIDVTTSVITNVERKSISFLKFHWLIEWGGNRDPAPDEEDEYEHLDCVA